MTTKSQNVAADVAALLRARNPLLWIVTREEARVERYLFEAASAARYIARTWDVGQGVCDMSGKVLPSIGSPDPAAMLQEIKDRTNRPERGAWIMRDLHLWLNGPAGVTTLRQVCNLCRLRPSTLPENAQALIVLAPTADLPPELAGHATVIEWPLPDREEIGEILNAAIDVLPPEMQASAAPNGNREAAIDAAVGLNGEEAAACYARSLVQLRRIDPKVVSVEKKRLIARERVLEWIEPIKGGLDAVGGLDNVKSWLVSRAQAYTPAAREYGLPAPRGVLLVGVSGCGKSLTAKAISTAWNVPLLRLDMGALKGKFVGQSEANLRTAIRVIEACGRVVVWIDEIEKAMAGATQGAADGGVSADALGTILTWMQERQGQAFVIATANNVESLPPELLRKGRFDEIFFVDTPNEDERVGVLKAALKERGRENVKIDHAKVARQCEGFTGAEIAEIVPDAMFVAFQDDARELTTLDLIAAASRVVPLTKTAGEKIARLREWAAGRARNASKQDAPTTVRKALRSIDL